MNLKIIAIFIVSFLLFLGGFFLVRQYWFQNQSSLENKKPQSVNSTVVKDSAESQTFQSKEKDLSFEFPQNWFMKQMDSESEKWLISNNPDFEIQENSITLEIEIQENTDELTTETSIDCPDKSTFCDEVEIHDHDYKQSVVTLNTGRTLILLGRVKQDKLILVSAFINTGKNQSQNIEKVESILESFK